MYEEDLALNNLQLICHKTKPNQINIFFITSDSIFRVNNKSLITFIRNVKEEL